MPATEGVRVEGLRELQRAFQLAGKEEIKELRAALRQAAEPVRFDAEAYAASRIRNIGFAWSRMRVGVTRSLVYAAPRQRGARGNLRHKRPNLAGLLMERALLPALETNREQIVENVDDMLEDVARLWGRGG
jgi:hypothetical protein